MKNIVIISLIGLMTFPVLSQDIDLRANKVRSTMQWVDTVGGVSSSKFIVANDQSTNSLKLSINQFGEVNWYLDGEDLHIKQSNFEYETGKFGTYDFIHVDGENGRTGINVLSETLGGVDDDDLTSSVNLFGSIATRVRYLDGTKSYLLQQDDHTLVINMSGTGNVTLNLPAVSVAKGRQLRIKRNGNAGNNDELILQGNNSELIDDSNTFEVSKTLGVCEIVCDGSQWWVMSATNDLATNKAADITISGTSILPNIGNGFVGVNLGGADTTLTLPTAVNHKGEIVVIKRDADGPASTGSNLTIDANGSELIDNSLTYIMDLDFESVTLRSNGTKWHIIDAFKE